MTAIQVTRTYLELRSPLDLQRGTLPTAIPTIERLAPCPVPLFRYLYSEVGRPYRWTDRLSWTDADIARHVSDPDIQLWLASWEGESAGYFELRRDPDRSVEIAYFGLLPAFIGRGWGKALLTRAVDEAWRADAVRVWLHTCTLDHPAALPNYISRGFRPVREETYSVPATGEPASDRET